MEHIIFIFNVRKEIVSENRADGSQQIRHPKGIGAPVRSQS